MGRYSYSQPSSSSASIDITSLLDAEAQLYADEAQSSFDSGEPFQNQPQPEGDDGIPTICYCGNRRKYSPKEDRILIGAWLNTSKDPLVGNEQRAVAFWKRIVDYYNASPQLVGEVPREVTSCKQRWSRINHEVSRFTGCYNQALREQRSGQNDDDVIKAAYDIFFTKYDTKFTLDHCWRELRHEQKWASTYMAKDGGKEKRRPVVDLDGPEENVVGEDEDIPVGVKAA
uniref:Myb-like domain-containing protein n=1 Tax=Brassica oleracea var. oleracea TaxID=109376 RepID=A0A0D3ACV3_BRAOL